MTEKKPQVVEHGGVEVAASAAERWGLLWRRRLLPESLAWWQVAVLVSAVILLSCSLFLPPARSVGPPGWRELLAAPAMVLFLASPVLFVADLLGLPRIRLGPVRAMLPPPE